MSTSAVTVRIEDSVKQDAQEVLEDIGLSMTAAVTVFLKAVARTGTIPFPLEADPFHSQPHQARLAQSVARAERGEFAQVTTLEALEAASR
ncbi:MAG: type II toxin-antitoxin system RelB/DinJ family antitoxin [Propionibacteriaceae bacterium]|jgi:DNA-damage-inducible protein J|nr:type II toxin-antitoxin system RelB/DinJ family antitoxin [Propionibacteriaceae bacterium]